MFYFNFKRVIKLFGFREIAFQCYRILIQDCHYLLPFSISSLIFAISPCAAKKCKDGSELKLDGPQSLGAANQIGQDNNQQTTDKSLQFSPATNKHFEKCNNYWQ